MLFIRLEIEGDPSDAFEVVDMLLDNGVPQDQINDHEHEDCGPLHVISAVVRTDPLAEALHGIANDLGTDAFGIVGRQHRAAVHGEDSNEDGEPAECRAPAEECPECHGEPIEDPRGLLSTTTCGTCTGSGTVRRCWCHADPHPEGFDCTQCGCRHPAEGKAVQP